MKRSGMRSDDEGRFVRRSVFNLAPLIYALGCALQITFGGAVIPLLALRIECGMTAPARRKDVLK
jgi:hypothetical protein